MHNAVEVFDTRSALEAQRGINQVTFFSISYGEDFCVDRCEIEPSTTALPHLHSRTVEWVYILESGENGAVTFYGDHVEHSAVSHPGALIRIEMNVPHFVYNPNTVQLVALRFSLRPLDYDTDLVSWLDEHIAHRVTKWNLEWHNALQKR